jgi:outer membrane protein OmpA-like peptidoglycan-associated protein
MIRFYTILFAVILVASSCASTGGFSKRRGFDIEKGPKYKGNKYNNKEGKTPVTILNNKRSKWEREHIAHLELIEKTKQDLAYFRQKFDELDSSQKINQVNNLLIALNSEIDYLYEKLNSIDIYTTEGYEEGLKLSAQLNDLIYQRIMPAGTIIKKMTIRNINADTDFSTGSSKLSPNGINTIEKVVNDIIIEINNWKEYLDNHNEKIFNQDKIILKINVNGYADMQGGKDYNQKLSEDRAKSVEEELNKKLKLISDKYNINFKIDPKGWGETSIPPGVIPNGKKNDPARRVVTIVCVTGPSLLIK